MSQPAVSRHLKVLEEAGLISRTRQATARISHLEALPLREATAWLAEYQRFWDERYGQLDELLSRLQQNGTKGTTTMSKTQISVPAAGPIHRHHPRVRRSP
jgi:DNA-binding MarR family transcriptional regulator